MSTKTDFQAKNTRLNANNTDLSSVLNIINNLPEYPEITLQEKTVSSSTSKQTVTPDTGYDGLSKVTVNAMATATQATPSISVSSSGLITASATQTAGYVSAGTKSATKQLTTKGATTWTPKTTNQTIASGTYLTGTQTIKGDSNLIASNIRSGKSIFGVSGTLVEGITPTGSLDITENGTYDVTNYASTNVNVASSGGSGGFSVIGGFYVPYMDLGTFVAYLLPIQLEEKENYVIEVFGDFNKYANGIANTIGGFDYLTNDLLGCRCGGNLALLDPSLPDTGQNYAALDMAMSGVVIGTAVIVPKYDTSGNGGVKIHYPTA